MAKKRISKSKFFLLISIFLILKISIEKFILILPYFKIEEIVSEDEKLSLEYLRGDSIFKVNFKKISEELSSKYPEFKEIILKFRFPYRLIVKVRRHKPIAKLVLDRKLLVDEEARIFLENSLIDSDLPEITGLQNSLIRVEFYKKYQIPQLLLSLDLIKRCPYKIKRIDATKKEDLIFFLDKGLKIKIGYVDYSQKLKELSLLIKELKEIEGIEYIDLRFSTPLVKYK